MTKYSVKLAIFSYKESGDSSSTEVVVVVVVVAVVVVVVVVLVVVVITFVVGALGFGLVYIDYKNKLSELNTFKD